MTVEARDRLAFPQAPEGPVGRDEFEDRLRSVEEAMARLEDVLGTQLQELAFEVEGARVDSATTMRQSGVDEAFVRYAPGPTLFQDGRD